jgi:transposase
MCPKEQRGIVIAALSRIVKHNGLWVVPSQTSPTKSYFVNLQLGTCTCADFAEFSEKCKHIYAAEIVARREGTEDQHANLARSTAIALDTKRKQYPQKWPAYNLAQTEEKHRFQILLHDLCRYLPVPEPKPGRPPVPLADAVFASVYKVYSTVSSRRFMHDLKEAVARKYLSRPVHYNSICAYLKWKGLAPILTNLIKASAVPLRAVETDFAADSTGFSTSRFVRWQDEKYGTRSGHDWVKAHVMAGTKTNVITAIEIRGRHAHEAPLFGKLLKATAENFQIKEVSADKAFSTEAIIEAVVEAGGTPYIPFKVNATDAKGGLWEKMLHFYHLNREQFLRHYHKRSNVESTFAMLKAKFRDHVRSRTDVSMKNEVLCKVLAHNLCCVIQSHCELGVEPVFFPGDGQKGVLSCTP